MILFKWKGLIQRIGTQSLADVGNFIWNWHYKTNVCNWFFFSKKEKWSYTTDIEVSFVYAVQKIKMNYCQAVCCAILYI